MEREVENMKIMWLCNKIIPISGFEIEGKPESWISAIFCEIVKNPDIELTYLYPNEESEIKEKIVEKAKFVNYKREKSDRLEDCQIEQFKSIVKKYDPDVIQIFGSEFPHTLAMVKVCEELGLLDRVVITIQGLVSIYSKHYEAYLPKKVVNGYSFGDLVRKDNLANSKKIYEIRGKYEEEAIKSVKHIIGRTDWDKACVKRLNPEVNYHYCSETMRKPFFENRWNFETCQKHSIFLSQWYSPLKGLHLVLEAMADLVKKYPDIHLYTTGESFLDDSLKTKIKLSKYKQYCKSLIKNAGLENHITFLGYLDENEMCERFLKSNVFVCASSIENSPNSVGEAMLLGVPTVSSDVGGVKNLMVHSEEGFIYPADEPYMLAYYLSEIFENRELAEKFSKNSRKHAKELYDLDKNMDNLLRIYESISNKILTK